MKSTRELLREKAASLGIDSQFVSKHFGDSRKNENWQLAIKQRLETRAQGIVTEEEIAQKEAEKVEKEIRESLQETVEETTETTEETNVVNEIISGDLKLNKKDSLEALGEHLASLPTKESIDKELAKIKPWIEAKAARTSLKKDCISLYQAIENSLEDYDESTLDSDYSGHPQHHAVAMVKAWANAARQAETTPPSDTPIKAVRLDAQKYIDIAIKLLESNDWREIAIGVGLLTGRRPNEICLITLWQPRDKYSITFQGISKKPELDNKVIGACLYDSEKIVSAVERLRNIQQFPSVYQRFLESGMKEARAIFNSNYGSGSGGLSEIFKEKLPELYVANRAFRSVRDFFISLNYAMYEDKFEAITSSCLNFAKTIINHDNESTTLNYDAFKFDSLPSINFPESYFKLSTYALPEEEKEKPIKMLSFNVFEIQEKSAIANRKSTFLELYTKHQDVAKAILEMDEMLANRSSNAPKNDTQPYERTVRVLKAMLRYNQLLMLNKSIPELDKNYIGMSRSMLTTVSGHVAGKQPSPPMAQEAIERNQNLIDTTNNPWMQSSDPKGMKRNNLHFRKNRDGSNKGLDIALEDIKKIFDAME
jgi:hypothetical protein